MYFRVGLIGPTQKLGYQYFPLYLNFEIKKGYSKRNGNSTLSTNA